MHARYAMRVRDGLTPSNSSSATLIGCPSGSWTMSVSPPGEKGSGVSGSSSQPRGSPSSSASPGAPATWNNA